MTYAIGILLSYLEQNTKPMNPGPISWDTGLPVGGGDIAIRDNKGQLVGWTSRVVWKSGKQMLMQLAHMSPHDPANKLCCPT